MNEENEVKIVETLDAILAVQKEILVVVERLHFYKQLECSMPRIAPHA